MTKASVKVPGDEPTPEPLGWAVIGMGRAGQSRVRVIEAHGQCEILAQVSRRPELSTATLHEVWDSPAIDAVVIATENARHAPLARAALEAGKHVVVEYPLANTAAEVEDLRTLARARGRMLHLEMIGLLTGAHLSTGKWLSSQEIATAELHFEGGYYRWVEEEAAAGHWGQLAMARLYALHAWFGPLALLDVGFEAHADGYTLSVSLRGARGTMVRLMDSRRRGQSRGRKVTFSDAHGNRCIAPEATPVKDLFGQDLQYCVDQIRGIRSGGYVDLTQVVALTAMAEDISTRCEEHLLRRVPTGIDNGYENG